MVPDACACGTASNCHACCEQCVTLLDEVLHVLLVGRTGYPGKGMWYKSQADAHHMAWCCCWPVLGESAMVLFLHVDRRHLCGICTSLLPCSRCCRQDRGSADAPQLHRCPTVPDWLLLAGHLSRMTDGGINNNNAAESPNGAVLCTLHMPVLFRCDATTKLLLSC